MKSHTTQFGTPGIGAVPYGFHVCHFYSSRQDLVGALIPYFLAGIKNHERCLWIASSPLPAAEVRVEAAKQPELRRAVAANQLDIVDATDWYGDDLRALDAEDSIRRLLDEEERAVTDGYQGLRVTGNTGFVPRDRWDLLMTYESRLQKRLRDRRVVACCAYHSEQCQPVDILEVVHRHDAALDCYNENWQIIVHQPS